MKNKAQNFFKPQQAPVLNPQISAMIEDRYWTVLNSHLLADVIGKKPEGDMKTLGEKANTVKHALQTYGPILRDHDIDFRSNKGAAEGKVFHSDMKAGTTTYVMEWTILDNEKRIIALVGFDKHENYAYRQKGLTEAEEKLILTKPSNQIIMERVKLKIIEAQQKAEQAFHYHLDKQVCSK